MRLPLLERKYCVINSILSYLVRRRAGLPSRRDCTGAIYFENTSYKNEYIYVQNIGLNGPTYQWYTLAYKHIAKSNYPLQRTRKGRTFVVFEKEVDDEALTLRGCRGQRLNFFGSPNGAGCGILCCIEFSIVL